MMAGFEELRDEIAAKIARVEETSAGHPAEIAATDEEFDRALDDVRKKIAARRAEIAARSAGNPAELVDGSE
jgi:hypothetical protein